jgi:glycosyltransferase involved in cell wall biosynthesis
MLKGEQMNGKLNIFIVDTWCKHWAEGAAEFRRRGHEVKTSHCLVLEHVDWADLVIFHPVDNELLQFTHHYYKQLAQPLPVVLGEAVDIDIYSKHLAKVSYSSGALNRIVFMAKHMEDYAQPQLPADFPTEIVPGGVNLDNWPLRQSPDPTYKIAWIGRYWIAKNLFSALQTFASLRRAWPWAPWELHILGNGWSPHWWENHTKYFWDNCPELKDRVFVTPHVDSVNDWLEDKDFLLQTSFKEAFGYVIAQAAAKGIQPVIQVTTGSLDIWPCDWQFFTHQGALDIMMRRYSPSNIRRTIETRYPIERRIDAYLRLYQEVRDEKGF